MYDWTTVAQYQGVYDYSKAKKIELLPYQRDILTKIFTPDEDGKFPYSTVIWSQPKKHGKTQIAASVGAWWSCCIEAPNEILTLASNQEQSAGLIFKSLVPTLYSLGGKVPSSNVITEIRVPNGTLLKAIPNNYAGQAGGNYGLTLWSELWTYKTDRDRRLYDELPPVPTRKNSIRWIETYAGFENESDLLQDIFLRIFTDTTEQSTQPKAKPVPGLEHITTSPDNRPSCWHIPEEGLFVFWDHEIRAPWISETYIKNEKASNRHSTFVRLWENKWQSSEGTFIEPEMYDNCVTLERENIGKMVLAGDASQRNDTVALVGVQKYTVNLFGEEQERYKVMRVRVFDPKTMPNSKEAMALGAKKFDIDLDETIAKEVKRLHDLGLMDGPFYYDPFQMHQVAVNLRKLKVPCQEFPQGQERLKADTFLWELFNDRRIDIYPSKTLEAHVKAANAKEYENEQIRIIKGTATESNKVDAAVALSMAAYRASQKFTKKKKKKKSTSQSTI